MDTKERLDIVRHFLVIGAHHCINDRPERSEQARQIALAIARTPKGA